MFIKPQCLKNKEDDHPLWNIRVKHLLSQKDQSCNIEHFRPTRSRMYNKDETNLRKN